MTLKIKAGGFRLWLKLPLCFVGAALKRYIKSASKKLPEKADIAVDRRKVREIVKALRAAKKQHGKLEILSVESEDGTRISIKL